jgi:hypothetical protein
MKLLCSYGSEFAEWRPVLGPPYRFCVSQYDSSRPSLRRGTLTRSHSDVASYPMDTRSGRNDGSLRNGCRSRAYGRTAYGYTVAYVLAVIGAMCVPATRGAEVRWSAGGAAGYFTEVSENIATSPAVEVSTLAQFTESIALGVLFDYSVYRPVFAWQSGSQWRALFMIERHWEIGLLRRRIQPFFQFGIGLGQMAYTDPVNENQYRRSQATFGPAARLAFGTRVGLSSRFDMFALVALDRMDSAINALLREYPTTIGLTVGATIRLPRGRRPQTGSSTSAYYPGER